MRRRGELTHISELLLPGLESAAAPRLVTRPHRPRPSSSRPTPAPFAWACVVLAIDPGEHSGWATFTAGAFEARGELVSTDADAVRAVVASALERAADSQAPCVLVLERPWGGSVATVAGLGAARERWKAAWRALGGHAGKVVDVGTSEYRAAVLGGSYASAPRPKARAAERFAAAQIAGVPLSAIGGDEAAAICIGSWAARSRAVGLVIGKRMVRSSVESFSNRCGAQRSIDSTKE